MLRHRRSTLRVVALLVMVATGAYAIAAAPVPNGDGRAIEQVIRAQMGAFQRDDAAAAFAFASPALQRLFGTADQFLMSVKDAYQPVYRPGDVVFLELRHDHGKVIQPVQIGMPDGKVWIAFYEMQRQPDKSWRINGCQLAITQSVST